MRRLLFLVAAWLCLAGQAFGQEAAAVIFASGNVQIIAADGTVRPAARGNVVNSGDTIETGEGKAQVIETVCQGCGLCTSTCPQGAIQLSHATDNQILAEVNALCQC